MSPLTRLGQTWSEVRSDTVIDGVLVADWQRENAFLLECINDMLWTWGEPSLKTQDCHTPSHLYQWFA